MISSIFSRRFLAIVFSFALLGYIISGAWRSQVVKAQTGCSTATTPTSNNQYWKSGTTISVYIDPNLPSAVQTQIQQAVSDFATQAGLSSDGLTLTALSAGTADPGISAANTIRFVNNANGSPNGLAYTSTSVLYQNGVATTQMQGATTSFNLGFQLAPNTPAYDLNGANASQFIHNVAMHELGHAFGLNDADHSGPYGVCGQTPGGSIMNGYCNTNDQGPHPDANGNPVPGGVSGSSVTPCDKTQVSTNESNGNASSSSGSGGGTGDSGSGGTSAGSGDDYGGGGWCVSWDEWDDETNTLTGYTQCF